MLESFKLQASHDKWYKWAMANVTLSDSLLLLRWRWFVSWLCRVVNLVVYLSTHILSWKTTFCNYRLYITKGMNTICTHYDKYSFTRAFLRSSRDIHSRIIVALLFCISSMSSILSSQYLALWLGLGLPETSTLSIVASSR